MEKYLSDKLRVISFILICLVVILHGQIISLTNSEASLFVQQYISGQIARVAVPFFFLISGFLFARNIDNGNLFKWFRNKIKKRISSLLIPYIVWSTVCLGTVMILQLIFPSLLPGERIIDYNAHQYFEELVENPTIAYQLWFVRDLFIVVLLSPILYFLVKYLREFFIIALFICWCYWYKIWFVSITSFTFFSIGMYIAIFHKSWLIFRFKNIWWWIFPIIWLTYCYVGVCLQYDKSFHYLACVNFGILAIWISYDLFSESIRSRLIGSEIIAFSFFIFILHEPTMTFLKKIYINTIGVSTTTTSLLCYFIFPISTILLCYGFGKIMRIRIPRFYYLLTGGR